MYDILIQRAFPYTVSLSHIKLDNSHQSMNHEQSWYYLPLTYINIFMKWGAITCCLFTITKNLFLKKEASSNIPKLKITRYRVYQWLLIILSNRAVIIITVNIKILQNIPDIQWSRLLIHFIDPLWKTLTVFQ